MSIFKESFKPNIRTQLEKRQEAMLNRTPQNLQYLNSRNSWIRMSSSVNIYSKKAPQKPTIDDLKNAGNYDNELAKQYILQGGTLTKEGTLKSGLGDFSKTYSNTAVDGTPYRLGIRPMPGITGIEVKSRGAYGSIRDVTVNFQCWDIKQLEDLELLYMRPGYTVLVEWGWAPYLDSEGKLQTQVSHYDIINQVKPKEQIWKDLTAKSEKNGNYEAHFGYVKNYSWTARMDGGYDCQTTIISLGEVLESLKVNYTPADNLSQISTYGLLSKNIDIKNGITIDTSKMNLSGSYATNILAGLCEELWEIGIQQSANFWGNVTEDNGKQTYLHDNEFNIDYSLFHQTINTTENKSTNTVGKSDEQVYIALESLTDILNNYVLLRDYNNTTTGSKQPFAKITTKEKGYDDIKPTSDLASSGDGYLLALAHPLQISIDPTVCLIKNKLWTGGLNISLSTGSVDPNVGAPLQKFTNTSYVSLFNKLIEYGVNTIGSANEQKIIDAVISATGRKKEEFLELQRQYLLIKESVVDKGLNTVPGEMYGINKSFINYIKDKKFASFYDLLDDSLLFFQLNFVILGTKTAKTPEQKLIYQDGKEALSLLPTQAITNDLERKNQSLQDAQSKGVDNLKFLDKLDRPYYINDDYTEELGIIGNIYINVNMLYELATSSNISSQDKKEKNEIALYDFIKSILSRVSSAIGNVNNFDIFIEPNESVARIIDINYVDRNSRDDVFEKAFQLEVHNLKSTVRSYKLESKIFPEQSTQIAIGAQVEGGALGIDASSLIDFNKKIRDRIIPVKDTPTTPTNKTQNNKIDVLIKSLGTIYTYFGDLYATALFTDKKFDSNKAGEYKNALKDLINFFTTVSNSNIKNRAIIPTMFSVEMDGIGGLIIGNVFKINQDLLPKGYKGGTAGSKLGYVITTLGHSVQNGDWVTKFDAQTIILDKPTGTSINFSNITLNLNNDGTITVPVDNKGNPISAKITGGSTKTINGVLRKNGDVDDLLVPMKPELYKRHWSSICQSDDKRIRLQALAMQNLESLLQDAFNAGVYIKVNSAYRTYNDQVRIKQASTNIPTATPGCSNHGFGAAVDLADRNGGRINPNSTPIEWQWIQVNKQKYKFNNINDSNESHHYNFIG